MSCSWRRNCMLYFLFGYGLRTKFPDSWEKWNTKKLCLLCYIWRKVNFKVLSLIQLNFVYTVPATITVLLPTQMWPENKFPEFQKGMYHSLSHIWELYTSAVWILHVLSLFIACTSKYISCFMWMWHEKSSFQSPTENTKVSYNLPLWKPVFPVSSQWFAVLQAHFQLVAENILFDLCRFLILLTFHIIVECILITEHWLKTDKLASTTVGLLQVWGQQQHSCNLYSNYGHSCTYP